MTKYLVIVLMLFAVPCRADVRLPKILGSSMVLQRDSNVRIWGWADPSEQVTVAGDWGLEPVTTKADARGDWSVRIRTQGAGRAHVMTITGHNRIVLNDILFGELWLASGQSNMEMPLVKQSGAYTGIRDYEREIAAANYPQIRLFQVGNFSSKEPREDVQAGIVMYGIPPSDCRWKPCSPANIPTFSATGYMFARELHRQLHVPIGIIDASWGGTSAECWTPVAGLEQLGYTKDVQNAKSLPRNADQKIPARLYNGMIHPLRKLTIRGAIWYQGESNAGRADKYRELFSTMITQWRAAFQTDFSFYFVQIAPFNYGNVNAAFLREAQLQTMALPKTGIVVTMDLGNRTDIHPKNKQEMGRRLALWALAEDYGKDVVCSGPLYKSSMFRDGKAIITFSHTGSGLTTKDGKAPSHFEIAGADKVFNPATAMIENDCIVVSCPQVPDPKAVRYAFTSTAMPNLMNGEGLPASSFRTDQW